MSEFNVNRSARRALRSLYQGKGIHYLDLAYTDDLRDLHSRFVQATGGKFDIPSDAFFRLLVAVVADLTNPPIPKYPLLPYGAPSPEDIKFLQELAGGKGMPLPYSKEFEDLLNKFNSRSDAVLTPDEFWRIFRFLIKAKVEEVAPSSFKKSLVSEIEIYIDPGQAEPEVLQGLLEALNDLHIASGGLGLTFSNGGSKIFVMDGATL